MIDRLRQAFTLGIGHGDALGRGLVARLHIGGQEVAGDRWQRTRCRLGEAVDGRKGGVAAAKRPTADIAHEQVIGQFGLWAGQGDIYRTQFLLALDVVGKQGRRQRLLAGRQRHGGGAQGGLMAQCHDVGGNRFGQGNGSLGMGRRQRHEQNECGSTQGQHGR